MNKRPGRLKVKNADIICFMRRHLFIWNIEMSKISKKMTKIVNIDEGNLHIFGTAGGALMKFALCQF